jgi:Icc protein
VRLRLRSAIPDKLLARMTQATPLRILQITDLHLKADPAALWRGFNVQKSLDNVLKLASGYKHWPPQVILVTGDIVDDESPQGYRDTYQRLALQLREQLGEAAAITRIGFIPGNHDDSGILENSCSELDIEGCGFFTCNNWQIVQLDSAITNSDDGELGNEQLALLDAALQYSPVPHTLVVLHHPLIKLGSEWMDSMRVKDADTFFKCIDNHNTNSLNQVRAVTWGHAHQQTDQLHKQVHLFGTPAAGPVQFKVASDDFAIDAGLQAGLRWLTLNEDGSIETSVHRLPASRNE